MLYGFGDVANSRSDTLLMMEEILMDYLYEMASFLSFSTSKLNFNSCWKVLNWLVARNQGQNTFCVH